MLPSVCSKVSELDLSLCSMTEDEDDSLLDFLARARRLRRLKIRAGESRSRIVRRKLPPDLLDRLSLCEIGKTRLKPRRTISTLN